MSPSARKVWIEISSPHVQPHRQGRRLPRGRCGLKCRLTCNRVEIHESPSARKVWIEIRDAIVDYAKLWVAFREEGVD